MYESHPHLVEPSDDTLLWRYMDFTKFLALLESASLHMAVLTSFDDPFEGHPPRSVINALSQHPSGLTEEQIQERKAVATKNIKLLQNARKFVVASCWHMNPKESAGMWAQYLRSGGGIAIQSTFSRLRTAIGNSQRSVMGAIVQYVDFDLFEPRELNILTWAALKRTSFQHEQEFRLLSLDGKHSSGFLVEVDLNTLIENVYVAPTAPNWILNLVQAMLNRYNLDIQPLQSELNNEPSYFTLPAADGA